MCNKYVAIYTVTTLTVKPVSVTWSVTAGVVTCSFYLLPSAAVAPPASGGGVRMTAGDIPHRRGTCVRGAAPSARLGEGGSFLTEQQKKEKKTASSVTAFFGTGKSNERLFLIMKGLYLER